MLLLQIEKKECTWNAHLETIKKFQDHCEDYLKIIYIIYYIIL